MFAKLAISFLTGAAIALSGAEYWVDFEKGTDSAPGTGAAPLRTFPAALKLAGPGDTIRLAPASGPVPVMLRIHRVNGEPKKPITVDGSFNVITGVDRIASGDVTEAAPGLFLLKRRDPGEALMIRFFMLFDGRQVRMGQHSKRPSEPLKKPEELIPFEWTVLNRTDIYFRLPEGATPESVRVEIPVRDSGLQIGTGSSHVVVKNLIATHFWNDGYNIHGGCRDIRFENIAAVGNGDDSVSAHEDCHISVKNLVAVGNGTGICHAGSAEADHENIYIAGSDSRDFFVLNKRNSFRKLTVEAALKEVSEIGDRGDAEISDALFYSAVPGARFRTTKAGKLDCSGVEFANYEFLGTFPGAVTGDPASLKTKVDARKAALYAIFGERLQTVLPENFRR